MDTTLWLTGALAGLAAFTGWLIKAFIAHLEADIAHSRENSRRGVELAERGADSAERK